MFNQKSLIPEEFSLIPALITLKGDFRCLLQRESPLILTESKEKWF